MTGEPNYIKNFIRDVMIMNYDLERVSQLEHKMEEIISELSELYGEVPSISRNLEMIKADVEVLKHSTMVD